MAGVQSIRQAIVWFRNDLRLRDNNVLSEVFQSLERNKFSSVLFVYCFDPRHFEPTRFGSVKTGYHRSRFLVGNDSLLVTSCTNCENLESVLNLKSNLQKHGKDLLVTIGNPEIIVPLCCIHRDWSYTTYVLEEVCSEERAVEKAVEEALRARGHQLRKVGWGAALLYHDADLPFKKDANNKTDIPNLFTKYREAVEKHTSIRPLLPSVAHLLPSVSAEYMLSVCAALDSALQRDPGFHHSWTTSVEDVASTVMECECEGKDDPRAVMRFTGGEDAALSRLQQWMFDDDNLKSYFEVRNGLMGEAYSSKLSPWLANGCISSRYVYYESKRYEAERNIVNKSTYWLTFELVWRDFFRLMCSKYGDRVFHLDGANGEGRRRMWSRNADIVRRWKEGCTGIPMVDANMRELLLTGWMSNRGRQIVSSYLVHNLNVDWRIGADHFESLLLDHDVASNYGNWNAMCGFFGGRLNKFNMLKQSRDYDSNGDYVRLWVPELSSVSSEHIFQPWKIPLTVASKLNFQIGTSYPAPLESDESIQAHGASPSLQDVAQSTSHKPRCFAFQRGECTRGSRCKFAHIL